MIAAVEVRERPILFSAPMVRAILDGSKTQTRRVVKPQPSHRLVEPRVGLTIGMDPADDGAVWYDSDGINPGRPVRCPYGRPLDRLWVRESWATPTSYDAMSPSEAMAAMADRLPFGAPQVWYRASTREHNQASHRWRPSIHMPRRISRITLEITEVRVERVQEISEEDARAEGVDRLFTYRGVFQGLWNAINGPRGYGWDANPWVWVLTFRRVEG